MTTSTEPLSSFTLFPQLPYDIRYKIWMESRPGPRVVYLRSCYLKSGHCHQICEGCDNCWGSDEENSDGSSNTSEISRIDLFEPGIFSSSLGSSQNCFSPGGSTKIDFAGFDEFDNMWSADGEGNAKLASPEDEKAHNLLLAEEEGIDDANSHHVEDMSNSGAEDPAPVVKAIDFLFDEADEHHTNEDDATTCVPKQNCTQRCKGFKSSEPIIPVLVACRESYQVLSRVYSRAFGTTLAFGETWFDFENDTLFLDRWETTPNRNRWTETTKFFLDLEALNSPENFHDEDAARVQKIALNGYCQWGVDSQLARIRQRFKNVKKITFIRNDVYRGKEETEIIFEDSHARELRNLTWWKYMGNYHPMMERILDKEYNRGAEELAEYERDRPSEFERHRSDWVKDDQMPVIEMREVRCNEEWTAFVKAGEKTQRQKQEFRMLINLRMRGRKNLRFSLRVSKTVKEMVALSRQQWNLPDEKVCEGLYDENFVEISMDALVSDVIWKESHDWEIQFRR